MSYVFIEISCAFRVDTQCKPCIMQIMETRKAKHEAHEVRSTNCLTSALNMCIIKLFFNNPCVKTTQTIRLMW